MTISQMRKVRFEIGKYLAPGHLASKQQSCDLPASLALTPALLTLPGQMRRKGPRRQGERRHGKKSGWGASSLLALSAKATDPPCTHPGGSLSQLLPGRKEVYFSL